MDIVERLRKYQCPENKGCNPVVEYCQCNIMDDSADEIERLQREIETLKESRKIAFDASIENLKENERFYEALKKIADRQIEDDDAVDAWAYCKSIAMIAIDGDE
jgi:vacuolar-type H+-ATPase subunit I/STV1